MSDPISPKVIVVVDLSRYSDIGIEVEEHFDANAVAALNDQIKDLIFRALTESGFKHEGLPYKGTGDGGILALDTPEQGILFAERLHLLTEDSNRKKTLEKTQRHFRVGVSKGKVTIEAKQDGKGQPVSFDFAGMAISNAVRLESACKTGEVLISSEVWAELPESKQSLFGPEESVKGKRDEVFRARRWCVVSPQRKCRRRGRVVWIALVLAVVAGIVVSWLKATPSDPPNPGTTAQTPVNGSGDSGKVVGPRDPIVVKRFELRRKPEAGGEHTDGQLGINCFRVVHGNSLIATAEFSQEVCWYLIALNPNGKQQAFFPFDNQIFVKYGCQLYEKFPSDKVGQLQDHPQLSLVTDDGIGIIVLILLTTMQPLASFEEFERLAESVPWKKWEKDELPSTNAMWRWKGGEAWLVDDRSGPAGLAPALRTLPQQRLTDACRFLESSKRFLSVDALAFPLQAVAAVGQKGQ